MGTALTRDPIIYLLGIFTTDDAGVDVINISKMAYLPTPYVGMFLGGRGVLPPIEA